jgi:hypothetical protein
MSDDDTEASSLIRPSPWMRCEEALRGRPLTRQEKAAAAGAKILCRSPKKRDAVNAAQRAVWAISGRSPRSSDREGNVPRAEA